LADDPWLLLLLLPLVADDEPPDLVDVVEDSVSSASPLPPATPPAEPDGVEVSLSVVWDDVSEAASEPEPEPELDPDDDDDDDASAEQFSIPYRESPGL
jgi:hypothetical protein